MLGGEAGRITIKYSTLRDAHLAAVAITNATLEEASGTMLQRARLERVEFSGGLDGVTMEEAAGEEVSIAHVVRDCRLDNANFPGLSVSASAIVEASSFTGARLNDSEWGSGTHISDSSFRWATMRRSLVGQRVRFNNCDLSGLDVSNSTFAGTPDGSPTFSRCEIDMINVSGVDLRDTHFEAVPLSQRIIFVDDDTLPPAEPGTSDPTDAGRELMTRAMRQEQYSEITGTLGVSEIELRAALNSLSPAFVPVYEDGRVGERGELLRRAALGEDIEFLVSIQREVWQQSRPHNLLLALSPASVYGD